ncbi:MAG: glycosyltransferase [Bacteroidales bacterium]|nr:glycosyltransferase [Bacteroidales bacterium]
MEDYPKISIVTPSYNQGQYLEETILSVLNQNYPNLEYIIIDGGSTDNSVEIIKKYADRITYWVSEPDNGQSHAINKGLEYCTGEIFNWLNSDDYYLDGALLTIGRTFLENPDCDIVAAKEFLFSSTKKELTNGTFVSDDYTYTVFLGIFDQPCTFIKFSTFKEILPLNTEFHYVMDSELYIRYLLKNGNRRIKKIDTPINMFRLHETSKSVSLGYKFRSEKYIIEYEILSKLAAPFFLRKYIKRNMAKSMFLNYFIPLNLNKKEYVRHICKREIPRLIADKYDFLNRLYFLYFYIKYSDYSGKRFFKCLLADYLFPSVYNLLKSKSV